MTLPCGSKPMPCGCCEGTEVLTPVIAANRPGLSTLAYRVGTHATFLETMEARLSSRDFLELRGLTTRDSNDPAIALLDVWATVADVLAFYQERIANEGYLRTATERRSILELARLVGYALRPGVASSVYLAFTLENNYKVEIPIGARAQSLPGPGELPQSFETAETLGARAEWNNLKPRMTRPQPITLSNDTLSNQNPDPETDAHNVVTLYFQGMATNLKPNDPLLLIFDFDKGQQILRWVDAVDPQAAENRTKVTLQSQNVLPITVKNEVTLGGLLDPLLQPPSSQPANSQRLLRTADKSFAAKSDTGGKLLVAFKPALETNLYHAWANAAITPASELETVNALRVKAALFGHNLPFLFFFPQVAAMILTGNLDAEEKNSKIPEHRLILDRQYDEIMPGSWIVVNRFDKKRIVSRVESVQTITVSALDFRIDAVAAGMKMFVRAQQQESFLLSVYSIATKVTLLILEHPWWEANELGDENKLAPQFLVGTTVYAQNEKLDLTEEPIETPIGSCANVPEEDGQIELDTLYDGLESGRWLIISGERVIEGTSGVKASELVMLSGVIQDTQKVPSKGNGTVDSQADLPGDKLHTFLELAEPPAYCYKRDTVTIHGNVVRATHGETRPEVLGSGDGSKPLQEFALRQSPLTYLSAPTPAGAASTLQVRVNDILWHEMESLDALKPMDRNFISRTDDQGKTTITFGNGKQGARLPTGVENVKAVYRTGIGKPGNVKAEQISLLATKPLGVKGVINPLRASGGADPESRDQARRNAPLAVMALDRLVSVKDYEDFARTYAGIGKASAVRLSDGHQELVHLSIAGAEDIPIDETSDLYRNLFQALHQFGDPFQPIQVKARELMLLVISAKVRLLPDYQWESVVAKLRASMLDTFGFERRELGQSVFLSEVISTIQQVAGVAYVDVDVLDSVSETEATTPGQLENKLKELVDAASNPDSRPKDFIYVRKAQSYSQVRCVLSTPATTAVNICPAQLAMLSPEVPDTLILTELTA